MITNKLNILMINNSICNCLLIKFSNIIVFSKKKILSKKKKKSFDFLSYISYYLNLNLNLKALILFSIHNIYKSSCILPLSLSIRHFFLIKKKKSFSIYSKIKICMCHFRLNLFSFVRYIFFVISSRLKYHSIDNG